MSSDTNDLGTAINDAISVMAAQRKKGVVKYGKPVEENELTSEQWLQHAQEEMADGAVYLARLKQQMQSDREDERLAAWSMIDDMLRRPLSAQQIVTMLRSECNRQMVSTGPGRRRTAIRMYVQSSVLDEFNFTGRNLISLSRRDVFPFDHCVRVIL